MASSWYSVTSGSTATSMCACGCTACWNYAPSVGAVYATSSNYDKINETRELEQRRKDKLRAMGEALRELARKVVRCRPQLPIGFHPLAPLARNNC